MKNGKLLVLLMLTFCAGLKIGVQAKTQVVIYHGPIKQRHRPVAKTIPSLEKDKNESDMEQKGQTELPQPSKEIIQSDANPEKSSSSSDENQGREAEENQQKMDSLPLDQPSSCQTVWIVDQPAYDEVIHHEEVAHMQEMVETQVYYFISLSNGYYQEYDLSVGAEWLEQQAFSLEEEYDCTSQYGKRSRSVSTGQFYKVVDVEAWDEIIHHEEEGHFEIKDC